MVATAVQCKIKLPKMPLSFACFGWAALQKKRRTSLNSQHIRRNSRPFYSTNRGVRTKPRLVGVDLRGRCVVASSVLHVTSSHAPPVAASHINVSLRASCCSNAPNYPQAFEGKAFVSNFRKKLFERLVHLDRSATKQAQRLINRKLCLLSRIGRVLRPDDDADVDASKQVRKNKKSAAVGWSSLTLAIPVVRC